MNSSHLTTRAAREGSAPGSGKPVLEVEHLSTCFKTDQGVVTAIDDVSFELYAGETLGIVGESGSGKTVTSKSIMRLLSEHLSFQKEGSVVRFEGKNLVTATEDEMRNVRGARIAMIFQEPMTSLNPVFTIGWQLDEALKYHTKLNRAERKQRAIEMLELVEMPNAKRRFDEYPHQLSGGMRQRVMIAMALCCEPDILIADEPTTALDVTIQAQILRLMDELKSKLNTAIMLITHDLGVVAQTCDRVLVMYAGRVVESAPIAQLFDAPRHPYTKALLSSIPKSGRREHGKRLPTIEGLVPSLFHLPPGCRFAARCAYRDAHCDAVEPELTDAGPRREVRCHYPLEAPEAN
ncbi:MAG: ABC transporter ATP-binding protein [Planctomycetes bacterium]|nr:ABC transporter ATP-binding protein [Planctomycetota bacterium]MCB9903383.1 ABC transporter ATP-binding protein [Planctomycetota bacterium]